MGDEDGSSGHPLHHLVHLCGLAPFSRVRGKGEGCGRGAPILDGQCWWQARALFLQFIARQHLSGNRPQSRLGGTFRASHVGRVEPSATHDSVESWTYCHSRHFERSFQPRRDLYGCPSDSGHRLGSESHERRRRRTALLSARSRCAGRGLQHDCRLPLQSVPAHQHLPAGAEDLASHSSRQETHASAGFEIFRSADRFHRKHPNGALQDGVGKRWEDTTTSQEPPLAQERHEHLAIGKCHRHDCGQGLDA